MLGETIAARLDFGRAGRHVRGVCPGRLASEIRRGRRPGVAGLDDAARRRIVPHLAARAFGLAAEAAGDGVRETSLDRCVRGLARPHAFEPVANVTVLGNGLQLELPVGRVVGTFVRGGPANPVACVERALLTVKNLVVGFGARSQA